MLICFCVKKKSAAHKNGFEVLVVNAWRGLNGSGLKSVLYVCSLFSFLAWYIHVVHTALPKWGKLLSSDYCCRHHDQQYTAAADSTPQSGRMGSCVVRMVASSSLPAPPTCSLYWGRSPEQLQQSGHCRYSIEIDVEWTAIAYKCFVSQRDEMHSKTHVMC